MFPLLLLLLLFISERNDAYRLLLLFAVFHFRTVLCVSAWIYLCVRVRVRVRGCVRMYVSVSASACGSISKHAVYLMHKQ